MQWENVLNSRYLSTFQCEVHSLLNRLTHEQELEALQKKIRTVFNQICVLKVSFRL